MCERCDKFKESIKDITNSMLSVLDINKKCDEENKRLREELKVLKSDRNGVYYVNDYSEAKKVLSSKWRVAELTVNCVQSERTKVKITSSRDLYAVFKEMWDDSLLLVQEQLNVVFINQGGEIIGFRNISTGKINSASVDINLILAMALQCRATGIAIAHNHPSSMLKPSQADMQVTQKLKEACNLLDIALTDHLILNTDNYYSFSEDDLL